ALISGPPRTATATALEQVVAQRIPEDLFRQNLLGLPGWAVSVAQVLVDRLRNTTSSLDKMLYERSHSVSAPGQRPRAPTSIAPHGLEIYYYPESDPHRLNLSGVLEQDVVDQVLTRVDSLRARKISPVILNFSNVVNVHRAALDAVLAVARQATAETGLVKVENVQLIAERFQKQQGLQDILHTSETPVRSVGFGETVIQQGDLGDEMYVVKSGQFSVSRTVGDRKIGLWTAVEGDVIGEMALISGQVRQATVEADRAGELYVIGIRAFRRNAYHIPRWFMTIIESLVTRIKDTNEKLDEFLAGGMRPGDPGKVAPLEVWENVVAPGTCRIVGDLTGPYLAPLKSYLHQRLRRGVRSFILDVAGVKAVDKKALKFLAAFHRYLLDIRGRIEIRGAQSTIFPLDLT
ncbi:MAG TPA: cyclic nucleotide-binding domain-containing protein, partial [Spirochaetia bacterium]|nr:cyclic nucleotide-binding domain-containing protein [Spirochaetia bacterium]